MADVLHTVDEVLERLAEERLETITFAMDVLDEAPEPWPHHASRLRVFNEVRALATRPLVFTLDEALGYLSLEERAYGVFTVFEEPEAYLPARLNLAASEAVRRAREVLLREGYDESDLADLRVASRGWFLFAASASDDGDYAWFFTRVQPDERADELLVVR